MTKFRYDARPVSVDDSGKLIGPYVLLTVKDGAQEFDRLIQPDEARVLSAMLASAASLSEKRSA